MKGDREKSTATITNKIPKYMNIIYFETNKFSDLSTNGFEPH